MARDHVVLGSEYLLKPPTTPADVHDVQASTCLNLSMFKTLMRQYRALDDSILMRLNRNQALARQDSSSTPGSECTKMFKDLIENWKGREEVIKFCVNVADTRVEAKQKVIDNTEAALDNDWSTRDALYADEVHRQQLHNELAVESIIRKRTWAAMMNRCQFFEPPKDTPPLELASLPPPKRERFQ